MLKRVIRFLKTSPLMGPVLAFIDLVLLFIDALAILLSDRSGGNGSSLLIIRLDVLGDYLMFRPYLRTIKESAQYRNTKLTILGNIAFKSLAETFDADVVDQFVWVDIYKLTTQPFYRFRVVQRLQREGFTVVFCPTYSRVLVLDDYLAWASGAPERIGCVTDGINIKPWETWLGNRLYTQLINSGPGIYFEMERDHRIVEAFLDEPVPKLMPELNIQKAKPVVVPERYVVMSLGAGQEFRVWPAENFAAVANILQVDFPTFQIVLTGAPSEEQYAKAFFKAIRNTTNVLDLTGKLSIPELVYVLTRASALLTNETGIAHIAASAKTPAIVISQGKSLVRWHPYPATLGGQIQHIYPDFIEQNRTDLSKIASQFNPESPFKITDISVDRVRQEMERVLEGRKADYV